MAGEANVPDVDIRVVLARLEAKVDVAIAQHGTKLEQHSREIGEIKARLDRVEDMPRATPEGMLDHETRIRGLERTPTVTPRQLAATALGIVGAIGAAAPFLDRLYA